MDFEKLSAERYSLRKFDTRPVEQEKLNLILEAGRNAPTAHNNQPQRIFVFRSPEALEKADACMDCHFHAPVVIGVGYDPKESWHREHDGKDHGEIDAAIAVTQMMLQAADLGLGTTYVGMFRPVDLVKTFPEMEGLNMIAMLPLGYPAEGAHPAFEPIVFPYRGFTIRLMSRFFTRMVLTICIPSVAFCTLSTVRAAAFTASSSLSTGMVTVPFILPLT